MALLKAADVVEMAMNLEKSGEAYYRAVSAKMESPGVKALFQDLADQEVQHYRVFERLAKGVKGQPIMLDEEWERYQEYLGATVQSALFEGPDKALAAAAEVTGEQEALRAALGFEKETMLFFHDLRDVASSVDEEVIGKIIDEEKRHVKRLAGMLKARE